MKRNKRLKTYVLLIKQIINSNLLLTNFNHQFFSFYSTSRLNLIFMDPFHFIKNIKQLLRLLQYLKGRKKSKLYIHTTKVSDDFLLFSKKLEVESKIKFFTKLNKKKRKFFSAAYLYLKEEFFMPNSIKKIFEKDFLLICSINSNFEKTRNNFYKFYIQIDEIKKMIFLFSLLNILHRK